MHSIRILGGMILLGSFSLVLAGGGGIGKPKKEDVPKYMKQLSSSNAADRATAAKMLGVRGTINANDVEDAVEPLKGVLQKDKDAKVRAAAARALGDIHPEAEETVPLLIDALKNDKVMEVKLASVVALGQYGGDAKEAIPALRDLATKFDAKKSKEGQTIMTAIQMINGGKKKKN